MGHGRQHIKGVAARRCQRRVGGCGAVQIQAEVFCQLVFFEDVLQQTLVARAEHHHVVRHLGVLLGSAEIPDEQSHRVMALGNFAVGPHPAMFRGHQVFVGPSGVAVAHHNVGRYKLAAVQFDPAGAALFNANAHDWRVAAQRHAALFQQTHQAFDDGACATHGRVNAPSAFKRVDECVSAGHSKRVAANQQGVKAHHNAQLVVADVFGHQAVQAAPCAHAQKIGDGGHQVADFVKGDVAHALKAQGLAAFGFF